jgi:hypothetical protein
MRSTFCRSWTAGLVLTLGLAAASTQAQTTGGTKLPPIADFGAFDPRAIPVELQAWWTPLPDDGKGYGHIHALCKWPVGQVVSGLLTSDCRITLHDNPSHSYELRFDVYNNPGKIVATYRVSHDCPFDGVTPTNCSWNERVALDTSSWGAGWQRLRVRATVKTVDGKRWTTSSDIVLNIRGAGTAGGLASNCESGPCLSGKGWYEGNDYQVARINNVPLTKVRGTHLFRVGTHKNAAQSMEVWVDKSHFIPPTGPYPAENPSAGVNLLTKASPVTGAWFDVTLDTTTLANGWHTLAVRSIGSKSGMATCSYCRGLDFQTGVAKVYFYVEN